MVILIPGHISGKKATKYNQSFGMDELSEICPQWDIDI
jgi:hypothetical protein